MPDSHEAERSFNVYLDFAQPLSLDSMEGVPSVAPVAPALPGEKSLAFDWQRQLHRLFDWVGSMAPGVVLAVLLAYVGSEAASYIGINLLGFQKSPLSPILITVMLGLLVRNVIGLPRSYEQGLRLCVKRILRVGVALLGLRLSITAVGTIGLTALPIVDGRRRPGNQLRSAEEPRLETTLPGPDRRRTRRLRQRCADLDPQDARLNTGARHRAAR